MSRQAEKRALTRQKLLDATFECLVELGYQGTSTAAVCRQAEVSRGTLLHHFPTRQDLVLGAMEDVLLRRVEDFRSTLTAAGSLDVVAALRLYWDSVRGPTFSAWLELALATRTDPSLDEPFRSLMSRFDAAVMAQAEEIAAGTPLEPMVAWIPVAFAALNGIALNLLQQDARQVDAQAETFIAAMESLATHEPT